jgi:myo-inositol-1(or 4)-monophosphatase
MDSVDWSGMCRRIVERQRELFAATRGIANRTAYEGQGEGGDMSLVLDRRCEDVVFEELERELAGGGPSVLAVSEERGEVAIGSAEASLKVVIDPIDGSLNVRRMVPSHSLSIAVASGESMDDVGFGFVHDFGADEEFVARAVGGATLNGSAIETEPPDHGLEVVGVESAEPGWIGPAIAALEDEVYRIRVIGSIAITMSYVGLGRLDAMFSARPCRSVDAAAAQLLVRAAGGVIDFGGLDLSAAPLGLDARYTVAAARRPERLATIVAAQRTGPAIDR